MTRDESNVALGAPSNAPTSVRRRILVLLAGLVVFSLAAIAYSLFRIVAVHGTLEGMNRAFLPLSKQLTQLEADTQTLQREMVRRLGQNNWADPHWRPLPMPAWLGELLEDQIRQLRRQDDQEHFRGAVVLIWPNWSEWSAKLEPLFLEVRKQSQSLHTVLSSGDAAAASSAYPLWTKALDQWNDHLNSGIVEANQLVRRSFQVAEERMEELRAVLKTILLVVIVLSTSILLMSERGLKPLQNLTVWVQTVARRGLRKEDRDILPTTVLHRRDEVGQLAQAFRALATSLIERERVVEEQKTRLQEQNRMLGDRVDLQARLQRAESLAAVGKMSAQVAHEVRNPLHSIGLEAEIALECAEKNQKPDVLKSSVRSILASVERLEAITQNYLRFARLGAGELLPVRVSEVLESVISLYAQDMKSKDIACRVTASGDPWILADRPLLEAVFGNLLRNAIQAHESDVRAERIIAWTIARSESGKVLVILEDNGPGIPAEIRSSLFDPFVTTKADGTGLGLSIVQTGVEQMRGTVECMDRSLDQALGQGAAFLIQFPEFITSGVNKTERDSHHGQATFS